MDGGKSNSRVPAGRSPLSVLPDNERERIVNQFNDTAVPYPDDRLVHEIFELQARRTPQAVAVSCGGRSLTYSQLNSRANRVAHALIAHHLSPDDRVGLYAERSLEMVIGILGILKAGGAYVPLDPDYPADRVRYMLEDCAPAVVLAQRSVIESLPPFSVPTLVLDAEFDYPERTPVVPGMTSRNLAYLVYTSGSTGQPKGVMIEHRSVLRLVVNNFYAQLDSADCVAHCSSPSFDAATWEVWSALLNGSRLLIVPRSVVLEPFLLNQMLVEHRVTAMWLTVALFNDYVDALEEAFAGLRYLLIGGDALNASTVARVLNKAAPPQHLLNGYGPTETTTFASTHHIREIARTAQTIPIGRPIANTRIYILDRNRNPVPIGMAGEIYIAGAGVARGYLNQPDLTAERFVADPFSATPDARLYRTGDLGRWRSDGNIEFLGRNDQQVKIRGFRVEPGEIEVLLQNYPGVRQAAVIARDDQAGEKRLLGYVVPDTAALKAMNPASSGESGAQIVGDWQALYEETYSAGSLAPSFIGWNSSYTEQPIPTEQMNEWLWSTVQRVRSLQPRRVLEVGCGVGLLLQHLAPDAEVYRATDFSAQAIGRLRRWIETRPALSHVQLDQCSALDLQNVTPDSYDMVIFNSVVQYFPDIQYLQSALQKVVACVRPGGHIFVGDVRDFRLLKVFHSSVQLAKAAAATPAAQLKSSIARALEQEKELVIDPHFFLDIGQQIGAGSVRVMLKRGVADNELTRYRYDVVLTIGGRDTAGDQERIDWRMGDWSIGSLSRHVKQRKPASLRLCNVGNRRLSRDFNAAALIERSDASRTAEDLQQQLLRMPVSGEEPEEFWVAGHDLGFEVTVSLNLETADGGVDVEWRAEKTANVEQEAVPAEPTCATRRTCEVYANDPLGRRLERQLISQIRAFLEQKLPSYMVPAALVTLDRLPVTGNGKLDRRALPEPQDRQSAARNWVAPQTPTEAVVCQIWQEMLALERIGIEDNFFRLGGHSLLAVKLVSRLCERFTTRLSVGTVFQYPTVQQMARLIDELKPAPTQAAEPRRPFARVPVSFSQLWYWNVFHLGSRPSLRGTAHASRLHGKLNVEALRTSLAEVVRRHEALRTRIVTVDAVLQQQVDEFHQFDLKFDDLTSMAPGDSDSHVATLIEREVTEPVDLAEGPLFTARLLRLRADDHVLILAMDHMISDAFSIVILLRDLFAAYAQVLKGLTVSFPVMHVQYADHAVWQNEKLNSWVEEHGEYWAERLALCQRRRFPVDRTADTRKHGGVATVPIRIGSELRAELRDWSRDRGTTIAMTVLTAYAGLLLRWCDAPELAVQFQANGRSSPKVLNTIGYFATLLCLRVAVGAEDGFVDLLRQVTKEYSKGLEQGDYSYVAKQISRGEFARNSIFNWVPHELKISAPELDRSEHAITAQPIDFLNPALATVEWDNDPEILLFDAGDDITGYVYYPADRFSLSTMERFARNVPVFVRALLRHPGRAVREIPLAR